MTSLLFRNVEVDGRRGNVHIAEGRILAVAQKLAVPDKAEVIDGRGGALIPGLWDHHIHLVALAAARRSLAAGPPEVVNADQPAEALRRRATERSGQWIRAIGYHESVAGHLDRHRLDQLVPDTPVRVQHRSGAMWVLNSAALNQMRLDGGTPLGLERDTAGQPTGRIFGEDGWLRGRLGTTDDPPDLKRVGRELASYGVVGHG